MYIASINSATSHNYFAFFLQVMAYIYSTSYQVKRYDNV